MRITRTLGEGGSKSVHEDELSGLGRTVATAAPAKSAFTPQGPWMPTSSILSVWRTCRGQTHCGTGAWRWAATRKCTSTASSRDAPSEIPRGLADERIHMEAIEKADQRPLPTNLLRRVNGNRQHVLPENLHHLPEESKARSGSEAFVDRQHRDQELSATEGGKPLLGDVVFRTYLGLPRAGRLLPDRAGLTLRQALGCRHWTVMTEQRGRVRRPVSEHVSDSDRLRKNGRPSSNGPVSRKADMGGRRVPEISGRGRDEVRSDGKSPLRQRNR